MSIGWLYTLFMYYNGLLINFTWIPQSGCVGWGGRRWTAAGWRYGTRCPHWEADPSPEQHSSLTKLKASSVIKGRFIPKIIQNQHTSIFHYHYTQFSSFELRRLKHMLMNTYRNNFKKCYILPRQWCRGCGRRGRGWPVLPCPHCEPAQSSWGRRHRPSQPTTGKATSIRVEMEACVYIGQSPMEPMHEDTILSY